MKAIARLHLLNKEESVKKLNTGCLLVMMCCGLAFAAGSQRKPVQSQPQRGEDRDKDKDKDKDKDERDQEHNKAVVRQVFNDLFSKGRFDLVDKLYSRNCVVHSPGLKSNSLNEAVEEGKGWRAAAPDLRMTADRMEVQGDTVHVQWTAKGTNTGTGNGVPATKRKILVHGTSTFRLAKGQIIEVTNNYDQNELFKQLGVNPTR
jgi:steroid delta-isomerase-like uncharacterized protein